MQESWAYPTLYQEHGNRATEDLAITVLQGRSVGGGTTVNWTSSFRTPDRTLALWAERHGVRGIDPATLAPHFAAVEARLNVGDGNPDDVNRNNRKLFDGAAKLGWEPALIRRNVKGCARLGYCGMGCPLDAKQSALITYLPDAMAAGADVFTDCRVTLLADRPQPRPLGGGRGARSRDRSPARSIRRARPQGRSSWRRAPSTRRRFCLRSKAGTGSGRVGKRTFLHPTVPLVAFYDEPVEAFYGAPQSVSVHHFADRGERVGYFLETSPTHPMLAAIAFPGFGDAHRKLMERLPHVQATIALLVDGHHDDPGGEVDVSRRRPHQAPLSDHGASRRGGQGRPRQHGPPPARGRRPRGDDPPRNAASSSDREADIARIADAPFGANRYTLALRPPDGWLRDGRGRRPVGGGQPRPPPRASTTSGSPTGRSSLPPSASIRRSRFTRTRASSRPRSRRACRRRTRRNDGPG